jgi:IMP dehydrogenase
MNEELFNRFDSLTFDDVLIVPGYTETLPNETDVHVQLTPQIQLNIPILSAAMDTVTEARLAIALAREGGLGIIHRNMPPEAQAAEVEKVKRSQSGMIVEPISLSPDAPLSRAEQIMSTYHISGVPITNESGKLVGILTNRDIRFVEAEDYRLPVHQFMTKEESLVTACVGISAKEAKDILQKHRIEKLPLVNENGMLKGLLTVKDIQKARDYPNAATDSQGRLLVGAAVGVSKDLETRVDLMVKAGVDAVTIDTAHGHSRGVLEAVRRIKDCWKDLPVIAGNVVTAEGTEAIIKVGADVITGAGMPQVSAIFECAQVARKHGISIIADGGIKFSGDIVKAIVVGGNAVMLGSMLAGLEEAPGEVMLYEGRRFKEYRGMGSLGAMKGYGLDRYATGQNGSGKLVPEGIEGRVPYKGSLGEYVYQLVGGLRSGMGYAGAASLEDLRTKTRLTRITSAGLIESHPHDVIVTKEAPNYQFSQR